jgi:succinyl-CoA synthetase alpha subunit
MVGGVTPGKGGTKHLDLPVFDTVAEAVKEDRRQRVGDLRAAALRGRRDPGSDRRRNPAVVCITEGIPVRDMVKVKRALRGVQVAADRPELPGRHHAGRVQDRHHARPHPQRGKDRHRLALRHADLRSGGQTTAAGLGQTTCIGIGGDPVNGTNFIDCLECSRPIPKPRASS